VTRPPNRPCSGAATATCTILMRRLLILLALTACAAPQNEAAPVVVQAPTAETLPQVSFSPSVWETAGSSLCPTIEVTQGSVSDATQLSFRYTGPGDVDCPASVSYESGQSQSESCQFTCAQDGSEGEGLIEVLYQSETMGEQVIGSMPVVHTQSVVESIEFLREDRLASSLDFEASFAVIINLRTPDSSRVEAVRSARNLEFTASVEGQGGFCPTVTVAEEVNLQRFPNFPRHISLGGDRFVVVVSVTHRQGEPMRHPFLKLEANVGGHRAVTYAPLQF
jgi:hypothetical protein